jgi:hypothetical protein
MINGFRLSAFKFQLKRLACLPVFLMASPGICLAQDESVFQQEWMFGVNGGMTSSKVDFSPKVYQKSLRQWTGGVSVRYITENHFGLQGELNLSQRGWQEFQDSVPKHRYTKSLLYAELPLLTHIYFNLGSRVRLVFNMGPQISYMLSESIRENTPVYDSSLPDSEINVQYLSDGHRIQNRFDWGIAAGGGFELRTGIGRFVLEGRYLYGLSDIYKNRTADFYSKSSNQVLNVKLTYFFKSMRF